MKWSFYFLFSFLELRRIKTDVGGGRLMQPPSCDIASCQQKSNVFIPVIVISTFFFLQFLHKLRSSSELI